MEVQGTAVIDSPAAARAPPTHRGAPPILLGYGRLEASLTLFSLLLRSYRLRVLYVTSPPRAA